MAIFESVASGWAFLFLIVGAVILAVYLVQKKQAVATKLALFTTIFLVLTVGYVYLTSGVEINSFKDFISFMFLYFSWLFSIFDNVKTITAQAIRLDWAAV